MPLPLLGGMMGGGGGGFTGGAATATSTSGDAQQGVEGSWGSSGRRGNVYNFGGGDVSTDGGADWLPWALAGGAVLIGVLLWKR